MILLLNFIIGICFISSNIILLPLSSVLLILRAVNADDRKRYRDANILLMNNLDYTYRMKWIDRLHNEFDLERNKGIRFVLSLWCKDNLYDLFSRQLPSFASSYSILGIFFRHCLLGVMQQMK
jgi:hypothetical protein